MENIQEKLEGLIIVVNSVTDGALLVLLLIPEIDNELFRYPHVPRESLTAETKAALKLMKNSQNTQRTNV